MSALEWSDLRFFLALARHGSVRAAGGALGVSHSTVARRVEALEAQISTRLFDRTRDGYALTDAGRSMIEGAERVEREVAAIERAVVGADERLAGAVRVTCTDERMASMILDDLLELCEAHPGIEIEIGHDGRNLDLAKREADLAVRVIGIGGQPSDHLVGRRAAEMAVASYVGAAHVARLDPDRGGAARWLGYGEAGPLEAMVAESSHPELPIWGAFRSLSLMVQALRAGLGIAILPCYIGDADPTLRRLTRPDLAHRATLWVLYHPDLRDNARLTAARTCMLRGLERRRALLEGLTPG